MSKVMKFTLRVFISLVLVLGLFTAIMPTPARALSGVNGTAPWTFDTTTNTLTIQAGTLAPRIPWNSNAFAGVISNQIQTVVIEPGVIAPADMSNFFGWWTSLTEIQGGYNLDVSNVTNMQSMLIGATSLTTIDVSNWDVSNVLNMNATFANTPSLAALDVSNWDTSSATNLSSMFSSASSLTTIDVSNWDTSNVTSLHNMFGWATSLTTLDVSNWATSNVTDMSHMFNGTWSLASLDLSGWDVSNVWNMSWMFAWTSSSPLTTLDLGNWDTSNVVTMSGMFYNTSLHTILGINNWDISNVVDMWDMSFMFTNSYYLTTLDLSNWDMSNTWDTTWMFLGVNSLQELRLGPSFNFNAPWNWDTAQLPEANSFAPSPSIYTGYWINLDTGWVGTAQELMAIYDGTTMAGCFTWQRHDGVYTFCQTTYEITYIGNSPRPELTVVNVPGSESHNSGTIVQISNTIPQLLGFRFTGWRNISTGQVLQPGATITLNGNITLEAQWVVDNTTIDPPIVITPPNSGKRI